MTDKPWRLPRLQALTARRAAARDAFRARLQAYLDRHRRDVAAPARERPPAAIYDAEVEAMGTHLAAFVRALSRTGWAPRSSSQTATPPGLEPGSAAFGRAAARRLAAWEPPAGAEAVHDALQHAFGLHQYLLDIITAPPEDADLDAYLLTRRLLGHLQAVLYPVRRHLPAFRRFWLLASADVAACEPESPPPDSGIQSHAAAGYHGGYAAYVPEAYTPARAWPLIVALHGGHGDAETFLWTWLRAAKSQGYLLVCPQSFGASWHPWDADSVWQIVDEVQARYRVETRRVLLTGVSDGGSFAYELGLAQPQRIAGLAVLCGWLRTASRHPLARRLPVYIAHGARDPLFPVGHARIAAKSLQNWGHDVTYHELPDWGHAYPRGENRAILEWFAGRMGDS